MDRSVSIAFIPLNRGAKLSATAIRKDFASRWPDQPSPVHSEGTKKGQAAFNVGESIVVIAMMPVPIPWSELQGPCETSWLWEGAATELRGHHRHLIVTVFDEQGPVERAGLLTRVCASVLATCEGAAGVYWGAGGLVVPSKIFRDFASEVLPEGPPLFIWVDFRVGQADSGKTAGFTHGLAALGHMEFETESASDGPGDLRQRLHGLGVYVLENGPVINDGDTIGEDAHERIKVVYADSAFGQEGRVMRLEYEPAIAKKKRWFGR